MRCMVCREITKNKEDVTNHLTTCHLVNTDSEPTAWWKGSIPVTCSNCNWTGCISHTSVLSKRRLSSGEQNWKIPEMQHLFLFVHRLVLVFLPFEGERGERRPLKCNNEHYLYQFVVIHISYVCVCVDEIKKHISLSLNFFWVQSSFISHIHSHKSLIPIKNTTAISRKIQLRIEYRELDYENCVHIMKEKKWKWNKPNR